MAALSRGCKRSITLMYNWKVHFKRGLHGATRVHLSIISEQENRLKLVENKLPKFSFGDCLRCESLKNVFFFMQNNLVRKK